MTHKHSPHLSRIHSKKVRVPSIALTKIIVRCNMLFQGIDLCNEREQIFKAVNFTRSLENSRCTKRKKDTLLVG